MQAARRHDDEPVDLPGQGLRRSHLLTRVLAGVYEEHLQLGLPRRVLDGSDHRSEVRIGDVGNDDGEIARPAGDQATGRPVRNEAERAYSFFDLAAGFGSDLLGHVDGARHRGRMHAGAGGDIEDRRSLLAPHHARPYTATYGTPGEG